MTTKAPVSTEKLIPVDIGLFRRATRDIDFDLYLKLSDQNVACLFSKTTGIDYKRLASYIQKGVQKLYIQPEDLEKFQKYISTPVEAVLNDPDTSQEKKLAILLNMTEQNMTELFSQVNVAKETASTSQKIVSKYVELMSHSPETLAVLLNLVSHGEYLYYHSIATSIFSMLIARVGGQFDQKMVEMIGLGGFLHDIGCTQLPKDIICSPEELNTKQWSVMHEHPILGLKMIEGTTAIPDEVKWMIYQHHEYPSGNGYPNKLRDKAIYYPAKIIGIADAFSALISKRPYREAYSVEEAIALLKKSPHKYDAELVALLPALFLGEAKKAA